MKRRHCAVPWAGGLTDYIYSKLERKTKGRASPGECDEAPTNRASPSSHPPLAHFMVRLSSAPGFQSLPLALVRTAPRKSRSLGTFLASR